MTRKPMPPERESVTRKMRIGKELKCYCTVGLYEDGKPGELFLTVDKEGTLTRGLSHALALMISLALQHGVPIEKIAEKLTSLRFEPAGVTGAKDIPMVHSIADYIGRWLSNIFVTNKDKGNPV